MAQIEIIPKKNKIDNRRLKVAAYCRVSTELEEQDMSFEMQIEYYENKINENPNWIFVDVFTDRESGLSVKRAGFQKMISACNIGKN